MLLIVRPLPDETQGFPTKMKNKNNTQLGSKRKQWYRPSDTIVTLITRLELEFVASSNCLLGSSSSQDNMQQSSTLVKNKKTSPCPNRKRYLGLSTKHPRVFLDCWRAFSPLWPTWVLLRCADACEDGTGWRRAKQPPGCPLLRPSPMLICSWAPPWQVMWIGVCLQIMWRVGCVCVRACVVGDQGHCLRSSVSDREKAITTSSAPGNQPRRNKMQPYCFNIWENALGGFWVQLYEKQRKGHRNSPVEEVIYDKMDPFLTVSK